MDPRVLAAVALVDRQPDVDVDGLAMSVNLSASRLRHLFRHDLSTPLHKYLKRRRLLRAEALLRTTFLSVKQVSIACGFNDANHFGREFRKAFAMPPAAYRRSATFDSK